MMRPLLSFVITLAAALAFSQSNVPPTVKLVFPKTATPGAKVKGMVEVSFSEGLHGYQNPPTQDYQIPVKVSVDTKGFELGKIAYPKGVMKALGGETAPSAVYEGTVRIPILITLPKKTGASEFKVTISYQQCNDQSCYPPDKITKAVKILVKK